MAGKVGEALAAVGVEPQGSWKTYKDGEKKGWTKSQDVEFFETWNFEEQKL